jgi:hypothetical protein
VRTDEFNEAVIAAIDLLIEKGATEIRITEKEDGTLEVWGNTEEVPAETITFKGKDVVVTMRAASPEEAPQ